MTELHYECMNAHFEKWHVQGLPGGFWPTLHRFTGPDEGDCHDHPWGFRTHVLTGGYVEEVYVVHADGSWSVARVHRQPWSSHWVPSTRIHRIVELPEGECWTLVVPDGPHERVSRFWRFGERVESRRWDSDEWERA